MGTPQIIYIVIVSINLLIVANKHGQEQGKYNIFTSIVSLFIGMGLLIWGGFFN